MFAERHTVQLQMLRERPVEVGVNEVSPVKIATQWMDKFEAVLNTNDVSRIANIMHLDSRWRDMLAFSWDFRTLRGIEKISSYVGKNQSRVHLHNLKLRSEGKFTPKFETPASGITWIESIFDFVTDVGSGAGVIRLLEDTNGVWKGCMVYTALQELNEHKEISGVDRPHGGNNSLIAGTIKGNWLERRQRKLQFVDEEPTVLIIGAGKSTPFAICLGFPNILQARQDSICRPDCKLLVCRLVVDRNARVGDNWRHRYRTLVTHDPVQYSHMAYLPFPSTWPLFTAKDKLGDWLEAYANIMELNVWNKSAIKSTVYDDTTKTWTVVVTCADGNTRILHPRHVVFCTGQAGEARIPTFPSQEKFEGLIQHASQHQDASVLGNAAGKKVLVVGTGNSGHDIAQNYYENGADVTMIQRRGTPDSSCFTRGMYEEGGPTTEEADIVGQSLPIPVQFALNVERTEKITTAEKATLDGLEKAGFKLDFGSDKSGIYRKYITRGGGYYIDVGASQLIIDGKVKVKQSPDGISHFDKKHMVLADGTSLEADVVVMATGHDNMRTMAKKIFGATVSDRCKDVWNLDEEGEVNAMWRPSGHPNFWFMGGSLALCRTYSHFLALQIVATEAGLIQ
ncbi:hypothetical protein LTR02_017848 [Friedmanniomyces endolithicus]|nr:hypothetical protein LTR02_017848 [Friedmanniomyces endolithicus]